VTSRGPGSTADRLTAVFKLRRMVAASQTVLPRSTLNHYHDK